VNRNFDEPAKGLEEATTRRRELRKLRIAFVGVALACAAGITARADWTPPESSVTPPAVVTLDAFAAPDVNGASPFSAPISALVAAPDGALYGSTPTGGAIGYLAADGHSSGYGTLFRLETNGTFTKLHDFNGTDGYEPRSELTLGPDGALYGSTSGGGEFGYPSPNGRPPGFGTLFRLETNGTFTKLHDFNSIDGDGPFAALVVGPDGAFYGSTAGGGTYGHGTLFRLRTDGTFTKLHDFNDVDGDVPAAALAVGPDGAFYGSTEDGGIYDRGTLYRVQSNGVFTKLHDFNYTDGTYPSAALVVGPDGALYGSTIYGGTSAAGTLFRLQTNGRFNKLNDFNYSNGANPGALVVGPDGALYGSTESGGARGYGTLFRLGTDGHFTQLHDFDSGTDGSGPSGALMVGQDGALYGSTGGGGTGGHGTLFRLQTGGAFTKLHDFNGTDGSTPLQMTLGPDGAFYGPTLARESGSLFRLQTNGAFINLYNFSATEGNTPSAPLVVGPDGVMYGSTYSGGTNGYGTLYRVQSNGLFTKLHDFTYSGRDPYFSTALVVGPDGAMYGSTPEGGTVGLGTLYRVQSNGVFTKLYDFNYTNGSYPQAALVVAPDGALYGSTQYGGTGSASGYGTLFRLETNGSFRSLHDFNGTDGAGVHAPLVAGLDGALYGTSQYGGTIYGTLFRVETDGTFTKLHDFNGADGAEPAAALVVGPDGALYGSTVSGGASGMGTLFRLQTDGTFAKLHDFNGTDGSAPCPHAPLVVGADGECYGWTYSGGTNGDGTLFRLQTDGTFTKLHDFNGADGSDLYAPLVVGPDGAVYGTTQHGGTNGYGTLFQVKTNGTFAKLYDFNGTNGAWPMAALVVGPDGGLYGTTPYGGPRRGGILFKVVLNRPPVARCHDVTVSAGTNCTADASVDDGSFDPDAGDTITLNQEPPGPYPLGTNAVTLTVTDNHGVSASCTATVTVVDATPPTLSDVVVTPNVLWPPNHKMVEVTVNYAATDNCGTVSNALSVTSNEAPADGTAPDWVIEDSNHVQLRADRLGPRTGREYTITVVSTDNAGNSSTRTVTVTVPRDQN
jgi:uncharacterized repeat protein (TIGR03803 family)